VLNSIPDCNVSLLVPLSIVALTTNVRVKVTRKLVRRLRKGKVIQMARKATAGPWWASACVLGTAVLAAHGESG